MKTINNLLPLTSIFAHTHAGTIFFGFDSVTVVPLTGGKKNPLKGRMTKKMVGGVAMGNSNYEKGRNKQLINAGLSATFKAEPRRWGERLANLPVVTHKGMGYLNTSMLHAGNVSYSLDNVELNIDSMVNAFYSDSIALMSGLSELETEFMYIFLYNEFINKKDKSTKISMVEVNKQLSGMTESEKLELAINNGYLVEGLENPDSIELPEDLQAQIAENSKGLFPRDFKAASITNIRVNKAEYTNIDANAIQQGNGMVANSYHAMMLQSSVNYHAKYLTGCYHTIARQSSVNYHANYLTGCYHTSGLASSVNYRANYGDDHPTNGS